MRLWRISDMLSDTGTLGRPFVWKKSQRAKNIQLLGDVLVWDLDNKGEGLPDNSSDIDMLLGFVRLADGSPEEILKFAQKWGVLALCKHFLPSSHSIHHVVREKQGHCNILRLDSGQYWEPIEIWRDFSREARAILRIASRLHQNKQGHFEDWKILNPTLEYKFDRSKEIFSVERIFLADIVEDWIDCGDVRLRFKWSDNKPLISFTCNLFGALACQLMFSVGRSQGIGICYGCGNPYSPKKRRPKANQRNYCLRCGRRAAWRDAKADQRRRQRSKGIII